jgi:preprotein translocase subunit SecB
MDYPIELKNIFFTRSIVIAMSGHMLDSTQPLKIGPVNNIEVNKVEEGSNEYTVTMRTLFNQESESSAPYMVDMECIALFASDVNIPNEEVLKHLTITGHSVVYGAIREAVSWITSRQPYGPLNLGLSILRPTPAKDEEATK